MHLGDQTTILPNEFAMRNSIIVKMQSTFLVVLNNLNYRAVVHNVIKNSERDDLLIIEALKSTATDVKSGNCIKGFRAVKIDQRTLRGIKVFRMKEHKHFLVVFEYVIHHVFAIIFRKLAPSDLNFRVVFS